jgi:hypothetical protein
MVMERFAREDVVAVFRRFGERNVRRVTDSDETEAIFLVENDIVDPELTKLTLALMDVLPNTKVYVITDGPRWISEPL